MLKRATSLLAAALLVGGALAQFPRFAYYALHSFTGTSGKSTLQIAASATSRWRARLIGGVAHCPDAVCSLVVTTGETAAATTTAATEYRLRSETPATSQAQFFTASNASGGTAGSAIPLGQGVIPVEMDDIEIKAGEAVSFTLSSGTSQALKFIPKWEEFER